MDCGQWIPASVSYMLQLDWTACNWSERNPLDINCFGLPVQKKTTCITEGKLRSRTWQQHQNYGRCSIRHLNPLHTWSCWFVHNCGVSVSNIFSFGTEVRPQHYTKCYHDLWCYVRFVMGSLHIVATQFCWRAQNNVCLFENSAAEVFSQPGVIARVCHQCRRLPTQIVELRTHWLQPSRRL